MNLTPRNGANLRGAIIVLAAMVSATLADPYLRQILPPLAVSCLGIFAVGLVTWRAFLDNSNAKANAAEGAPLLGPLNASPPPALPTYPEGAQDFTQPGQPGATSTTTPTPEAAQP